MAARTPKIDMSTFLDNVFASAQRIGTATSECVALLKSGNISFKEADKDRLDLIARAFKLGRISQIMGVDKVNAELVQDKIKHDPSAKGGNSDKRRTMQEQKAYDAAKSAWSHVSYLAGRPNTKTGSPRASKAAAAEKAKVEAAKAAEIAKAETAKAETLPSIKKVKAEADIQAFALRCAEVMLSFQNRNASMVGKTEWFALFAEFGEKAKALAKPAEAEPTK